MRFLIQSVNSFLMRSVIVFLILAENVFLHLVCNRLSGCARQEDWQQGCPSFSCASEGGWFCFLLPALANKICSHPSNVIIFLIQRSIRFHWIFPLSFPALFSHMFLFSQEPADETVTAGASCAAAVVSPEE